ncbi:MAG: carbon storage regulator [Planctomycetota bacterium]
MLVLSRKVGEKLMIGDDVVLTINRISGNRVAIGIEAPRDVRVVRGELPINQVAPSPQAPNTASMGDARVAIASKADA